MSEPFICPRQRDEAVLPVQREHMAHVREDGTCSYCGSMTEERFFACVEAGNKLGPTDKSYKVYVEVANPEAGRLIAMGRANHYAGGRWQELTPELQELHGIDPSDPGKKEWVLIGASPATKDEKFYFQHLSEAGKRRFIDLLNAGKVTFGYPGRFYVPPFFTQFTPA
jgi:hypothetical protein